MTTEVPEDERQARVDELTANKRYNMKSLGRLVDSNRLTGVARTTDGPPSLPRRDDTSDDAGPSRDAVVEETAPAPGTAAGSIGDDDSTDRVLALAAQMDIPIRLTGGGGGSSAGLLARLTPESDDAPPDDGVDRSGLGGSLTRTGLAGRFDDFGAIGGDQPRSPNALARQMLDGEIGPGGRISDPRDVPGIVLDLAKDVPASVAVSVVRIDEEVEIVGDSIDPSIDPAVFTSVFSSLFRSVRPAVANLENGPLGAIRDVVIEGEKMDLILRPLGARYFLLVLEDRNDPRANLAATRMRMASIAPGVTAILAQQDGEV